MINSPLVNPRVTLGYIASDSVAHAHGSTAKSGVYTDGVGNINR